MAWDGSLRPPLSRSLSCQGNTISPRRFSNTAGYNHAHFTIDSVGKIDYDSVWDGVWQGRSTSTLVVKGARLVVNARALSHESIDVDGLGWSSTKDALILNLMPGKQEFKVSSNVAGYNYVDFHPGCFLERSITPPPTIRLLLVEIWGHCLFEAPLFLSMRTPSRMDLISVNGSEWQSTQHVIPYVLIPGNHELRRGDSMGNVRREIFTVAVDGHVSYDPSVSNFFSGEWYEHSCCAPIVFPADIG